MSRSDDLSLSDQTTPPTADEAWHLNVDQDRCLGSGVCVSNAPDYFRLDGAHSVPIRRTVPPNPELDEVADLCPSMAIRIRRTAEGDQTDSTPDG